MNDKPTRFNDLLEKWCDGTLTVSEQQELESQLADNPQAQEQYVQHMEMHGRLSRLLRATDKSQNPLVRLPTPESVGNPENVGNIESGDRAPRFRLSSRAMAIAFLAASVLGIVFWQSSVFDESSVFEEEFIARVTEKIDCQIESARWENKQTDQLAEGQTIVLNKGLLALEFGCGATVAIEGPAEFEVVSAIKGILHFGKLTANAPEQAKGFTIETPNSESVDLGTAFGVRVDARGISETHVFEGEVLVYGKDNINNRTTEHLRLLKGQASRVSRDLGSAKQFAANAQSFMKLPERNPSRQSGRDLPFGPKDKLALWFDAAEQVQTDELYRVVSWGDLATAGNIRSENAWQVESAKRPYLISDAMNGLPAIRFMGREHLVTEPVATGDDVTILIVCKMLPNQLQSGQMATLFDFGSLRDLSLYRNPSNYFESKVSGYWKNGVNQSSGWIAFKRDSTEIPLVLSLVYSRNSGESAMYINGTNVGTAGAWLSIATDISRFIGSQHDDENRLVGEISEILVFDSELDQNTLSRTTDMLLEKYSIDPRTKWIEDEES